ncbi:hypothetical protein DXG01_012168, partial [Tephrocybe rancida]
NHHHLECPPRRPQATTHGRHDTEGHGMTRNDSEHRKSNASEPQATPERHGAARTPANASAHPSNTGTHTATRQRAPQTRHVPTDHPTPPSTPGPPPRQHAPNPQPVHTATRTTYHAPTANTALNTTAARTPPTARRPPAHCAPTARPLRADHPPIARPPTAPRCT